MDFLENLKDLLRPEWLLVKSNYSIKAEGVDCNLNGGWAEDSDDLEMSNRMDLFHLHFRDVDDLVPLPTSLNVTGEIPKWLRGRFVRVGPGKFDLSKDFSLHHWFDGYSLLLKLDIDDSGVTLTKKFLQSDAYKKAITHHRPVFTEFGTKGYDDPDKNIFFRVMSKLNLAHVTDNNAANIVKIFGKVFAFSETCYIHEVDPMSLETGKKVDFYHTLGMSFLTSHPLVDGDVVYNIGTGGVSGIKHYVIKMENPGNEPLTKKASIIASFHPRWKASFAYIHSFAMSKKYVIFVESPMLINIPRLLMCQARGLSLRECMDWCPEENNRFVLIEKETGHVIKTNYMTADPFFFFHVINAFDHDDELVIDLIGNDSPVIVDNFILEKCRSNIFSPKDPAFYRRFVLPLRSFKEMPSGQNLVKLQNSTATAYKIGHSVIVRPETFGDQGYENPSMHPNNRLKPYRYFYATSHFYGGPFANSIVKVDLEEKIISRWHTDVRTFPTEAVFVPRPDGVEEDDGILLTTVTVFNEDLAHLDPTKRRPPADYLLGLDARTMKEVFRAETNSYLPMLLHGLWLQQESNASPS